MSGNLPRPARFEPYHELDGRPSIIVDGKPAPGTVLTLSHWPVNNTPEDLKRDTSTDTAFAYLDAPEHHVDIELVSNSHYDEDGLLSMFALVDPVVALEHRELLINTSYAGDFWLCPDAEAARLSFVLAACADPTLSPLTPAVFDGCIRARVKALYSAMLSELPALIDSYAELEHLWGPEWTHVEASNHWLDSGTVSIEEFPGHDLAVVTIPEHLEDRTVRRYLHQWARPVHPMAVFERTTMSRIVWLQGQRFEAQYRYESWVQLASRRPSQRRDLSGLADLLNADEQQGEWIFDGVDQVAPRLRLRDGGTSGLTAADWLQRLKDWLDSAPVAWDPWSFSEGQP